MYLILVDVVTWLYYILFGLLMVRVILTWLPQMRIGNIGEYVHAFTEPVLSPIRYFVDRSPLGGPGLVFDMAPLVAFFLLRLLRVFLHEMLFVVFF